MPDELERGPAGQWETRPCSQCGDAMIDAAVMVSVVTRGEDDAIEIHEGSLRMFCSRACVIAWATASP